MKILLIGNGGRENAIAWKIYNSKSFIETKSQLYCTIGNPGINKYARPVNIKPEDIKQLKEFAVKEKIDFTVVGPEIPLSSGIVNEFEKSGLKIFGPVKEAAGIESSKIFAKNIMVENEIPTADYKEFSSKNIRQAEEYFSRCRYPMVIKADGLAAGKGVIIAESIIEAQESVKELYKNYFSADKDFKFIAEEFLTGEEVSVFVITDGDNYVILPFSQDHKKIFDGDTGKNTGGMGAVAPVKKFMNEKLELKIKTKIVEPVLKALKNSGREFKGCLYCGLMIVNDEPFVIEFNCRFGDPETQAVLPLIESDFLELLLASTDESKNELKKYSLKVNENYACCVVLASSGYPDKFETGKEITGLKNDENKSLVFHSGTKYNEDLTKVLSNGGRILSVVGISEKSLEDAVKNAYEEVNEINFENVYYRQDIGFKQLTVNS